MSNVDASSRGFPARTRARSSDPDTSHKAASDIVGDLREVQSRVFRIVQRHGPLTQHAIIARYRETFGAATPESTVRTRVSELVKMGLLRDSGRRERAGRREAVLWEELR